MIRFFLIFLFLTLISFNALSEQTIPYYADRNGICSTDADSLCRDTFDRNYISTNTIKYGFGSCSPNPTTPSKLDLKFTSTAYSQASDGSWVAGTITNRTGFGLSTQTKVCADTEEIKLTGCTASCVPKQDPCAESKDQEETLRVQCGIISCEQGATVQDLGSGVGMACSSGIGRLIASEPPSKLKRGDCEWVQSGALETPDALEDVTGDIAEAGQQNAPVYCTTTYKSLGRKYVGDPPPANKKESTQPKESAKKFAPSVTPREPDGGCKSGWTAGEFGSGSNLTKVCAAPYAGAGSGSGSGDGSGSGSGGDSGGGSGTCTITGQTKVNGVCSCLSGLIVQNNKCTSSGGGGGDGSTCDPTKSICEGSGDGSASTGNITKPEKIENTVTESWWESEYEDGMTGVWNKHKESFQSTPFVEQLNEMKNGAPNSGTCPSFDFQFLQYGGTLQPPCLIWPALKAFFLFMTLMLCRRIIFGG